MRPLPRVPPSRVLLPVLAAAALLAGCVSVSPRIALPTREQVRALEPVAVRELRLRRALDGVIDGFGGTVGVYIRHLGTGETASVNADTLFPTASMVKVPIMVGVFEGIEAGRLRYDQPLLYRTSMLYEGEDIVGLFRDSVSLPLSEVQMLSITTSDNTASLWLQGIVGGEAINAAMARLGLQNTRVNSRTPGREAERGRFGWGQTTPREMATLVAAIREGRAVSPGADEEMYRILTRIYWNDEALSSLPPWVQVASKQGAVNRSRSEVLLVNAPHGDYVVCVITKNQTDESWTPENEGYRLLRRVSALAWQHFEPDSRWAPPPGTRY